MLQDVVIVGEDVLVLLLVMSHNQRLPLLALTLQVLKHIVQQLLIT